MQKAVHTEEYLLDSSPIFQRNVLLPVVMASFTVLSQNSPAGTKENKNKKILG
jgi:hypothetical protein